MSEVLLLTKWNSEVDKFHWILDAWFSHGVPSYFAWNCSRFVCIWNTKDWICGRQIKNHLSIFLELSHAHLVWVLPLFIYFLLQTPAVCPLAPSLASWYWLRIDWLHAPRLHFPHSSHYFVSGHLVCTFVLLEINPFLLSVHITLANMRCCNSQTNTTMQGLGT